MPASSALGPIVTKPTTPPSPAATYVVTPSAGRTNRDGSISSASSSAAGRRPDTRLRAADANHSTARHRTAPWKLFEATPPGWPRVQAICDFVHRHIAFGYEHARATKTAWEAFNEGKGVCRDYAHLAIAFCRCMNIPARYCTGYLSDIGTPKPWAAGDFAGWFEAYLDGRWHTFDPRNNEPRIGRVLIAQGRDASDVPITQTFGPNTLVSFKVWTDEIPEIAAKAS